MDIAVILNKKVSLQADTWAKIDQEVPIGDMLKEIRSDKYAQKINFLRKLLNQGNQEAYGIHKKTLPCVTVCATFNGDRKKDNIKEYNYLIVLDIDKLVTEEFQRVKQVFQSNNYVFSFWESPSGNGLKGLVAIAYDFPISPANLDQAHKSAFKKLSDYFNSEYNIELDESGSDTTRLCFLSYDPGIVIKDQITGFGVKEADLIDSIRKSSGEQGSVKAYKRSRDTLFNPLNKNKALNRKTMQSIIKYLEKRQISITASYDEWYKVAYAIADTFTYDIGEKYFLGLCKLDGAKYHEENCRNMLKYSYGNRTGQLTFSTIIYFANQKGYLTNTQRSEVSKTVPD